jgi:hypothetical protein
MGRDYISELRSPRGRQPIVHPPAIWICSLGGILTGEKQKTWESLSQCHSVHHKPHRPRASALDDRRLTAWAMARRTGVWSELMGGKDMGGHGPCLSPGETARHWKVSARTTDRPSLVPATGVKQGWWSNHGGWYWVGEMADERCKYEDFSEKPDGKRLTTRKTWTEHMQG